MESQTQVFLLPFAAWDLDWFVWGFGCEGNKDKAQQNMLRGSRGAALSSQAAVGGTLGGCVSDS